MATAVCSKLRVSNRISSSVRALFCSKYNRREVLTRNFHHTQVTINEINVLSANFLEKVAWVVFFMVDRVPFYS